MIIKFGLLQAGYCSEVPLKGDSILPIRLLILLSTYVQSLPVPTSPSGTDQQIFYSNCIKRFSGFINLTQSQCFLGLHPSQRKGTIMDSNLLACLSHLPQYASRL
jgi:hypothetical protein